MRRNHRAGLLAQYSTTQTLLAALTMALAVVAVTFVAMYPGIAALAVGGAAVSWLLATVALRVRLTRRPSRRYLLVRVPYTDLQIEV